MCCVKASFIFISSSTIKHNNYFQNAISIRKCQLHKGTVITSKDNKLTQHRAMQQEVFKLDARFIRNNTDLFSTQEKLGCVLQRKQKQWLKLLDQIHRFAQMHKDFFHTGGT